jgi:Na+/melibiose symporter-like transporter
MCAVATTTARLCSKTQIKSLFFLTLGILGGVLCAQIVLNELFNMAAREGFARIKKVLAIVGALWTIACAAMFWSWGDHSGDVFLFCLILAAVPIAAAWGLLWVIEGFLLRKDAL